LNENLDILHKLSEELLEKETVLGAELDELIQSMRPGVELPFNKPQEKEDNEKQA
jgi:cell division protease FtsH